MFVRAIERTKAAGAARSPAHKEARTDLRKEAPSAQLWLS